MNLHDLTPVEALVASLAAAAALAGFTIAALLLVMWRERGR